MFICKFRAMELFLPNNVLLELKNGIPENYSGTVFPRADAFFAKSNLSEITIQELTGNGYKVRLTIGKFLDKIIAKGWGAAEGLYGTFMLKNNIRKNVKPIGTIHLRQNYYSLFYITKSDCTGVFDASKEFQLLDVYFSPKLLKEIIQYFPEISSAALFSDGAVMGSKANWTYPSIKEICTQILNCPYDELSSQFYFDLKVRELLFQLLQNAFKTGPFNYHFTPFETARIHQAKTMLETFVDKKPPTVKYLSRKVGVNELKLRIGFKKYFNTSILEWLTDCKWQHAKELVLTTNKPIKEIAALIGYPRTTNFITGFRRKFGSTPGALRR